MSVALSTAFKEELRKGTNSPTVVLELELDSGTVKYSFGADNFTDTLGIIGNVSSITNKLDTKKGYSTRGQITFTITGRDNFKSLVKNEYLKNRRVSRYDGFVGLDWGDYVKTFTGTIQDLSRQGDTLTVTVADDVQDTKIKLPVENSTKTQFINYMNMNPVDIMLDILKVKLGIDASLVDTTTFESERDTWRNSWAFGRVLREPTKAEDYLNELQEQTQSFIIHDGQQISYKVIAPPIPSEVVMKITDDDHIMEGLSWDSGYKDNFYNNVVVYYDWDESDKDNEANFESAEIVANTDSQGSAQWNEIRTKVIKSKWLRTLNWIQPTNITGVTIFHTSKDNGTGTGTLSFDVSENTLKWQAPSGVLGSAVTLDSDGQYQLFDVNTNKYVRVIVDTSSLPVGDQTDGITITSLSGANHANTLATKILQRYVDPTSTVSFSIDLNEINNNGNLLKVSDTIQMTTDEAFDQSRDSWSLERLFVTQVLTDFSKGIIKLKAVQSRVGYQSGKRYGFISPPKSITLTGVTGTFQTDEIITGGTSGATATIVSIDGTKLLIRDITGTFQVSETITGGTSSATGTSSVIYLHSDYGSATDTEKFYCYVGDASNLVNSGTEDGYYII